MARPRFTELEEEIHAEWNRLVFETEPFPHRDRKPPAEIVDGMRALYGRLFENGHWAVNFPTAKMVSSSWSWLFVRQSRFADAVVIAEKLETHPSCEPDLFTYHLDVASWSAEAGNVERAIELFEWERARAGRFRNSVQIGLLRSVMNFYELDRPDEPIDPKLKAYLLGIMADTKGLKALVKQASETTTRQGFSELIVHKLYPNMKQPERI